MTAITAVERCAMSAADRARARHVVLHHARDKADAAELLDMLGLVDAQQDSANPHNRGGLAGRQPGEAHPLSAATAAQAASTGQPTDNTPDATPAAAAPTAQPPAAVDRRCEGCDAPVVPQTRYKLDRPGYLERGIRLLAAKNRCHPCYNRLRRPTAADDGEPKNDVGHNSRPATDGRRPRARRRTASPTPALHDLVDQLTALRKQVRHLRTSHPDHVPLACVSAALGEARRHLEAANIGIAESTGHAPTQGGGQ